MDGARCLGLCWRAGRIVGPSRIDKNGIQVGVCVGGGGRPVSAVVLQLSSEAGRFLQAGASMLALPPHPTLAKPSCSYFVAAAVVVGGEGL